MSDEENILYNSQLDAFTLYHIVQETEPPRSSTGDIGPALPALGHALAGALASAVAKAALYPLDLVVTRLQVQKQLRGEGETDSAGRDADAEYTSIVDAATKIYANEGGIRAFYTGCPPEIGKGIIDSFLFFLAYTFLRQRQLRIDNKKHLTVPKELAVGVIAGAISKFVTTPIQNIITRQQTAALVAARNPSSSGNSPGPTVREIAQQIHRERGLTGFWAGYAASLILTVNPSITFAVDNLLRQLLPKSYRKNPPSQLVFLIAASSKAVATSITYPISLAKSRAQAVTSSQGRGQAESKGANEKGQPPAQRTARQGLRILLRIFSAQYAIFQSLRKIVREEGVAGIYSGLEGEVLKGFLQHGLTMMVKERAHVGVIQSYYLLLRATKKWDAEATKAKEAALQAAEAAKQQVENVSASAVEGGKQILGAK